jgi:hypothetical protein
MTPKFKYALAAVAMMAAPAAQALTVNTIQLDDSVLTYAGTSENVGAGDNINAKQFTFSWDLASGDTGVAGASGAFEFTFLGQAKITFDGYTSSSSDVERTGFVLYNTAGGPALTLDGGSPAGTTGGGVSFVNGKERILIGDDPNVTTPASTLYDAIDGTDAFTTGTYRVGFFDAGTPETGSITMTVTAVPLPASVFLMLAGLGALGAARRFAS